MKEGLKTINAAQCSWPFTSEANRQPFHTVWEPLSTPFAPGMTNQETADLTLAMTHSGRSTAAHCLLLRQLSAAVALLELLLLFLLPLPLPRRTPHCTD